MDAADVRGTLGLGYLELRTALAGNDRLEEAPRRLAATPLDRLTNEERELVGKIAPGP